MKLISLNIERNRHYQTVIPFLEEENADIVCLQEVPEEFTTQMETLGYSVYFSASHQYNDGFDLITEGLMIASKTPLQHTQKVYYHRTPVPIPLYDKNDYGNTCPHFILMANIDGLNLATTHFPVTEDKGVVSIYQKHAITELKKQVGALPPHILCGDFNIPRGHNPLYADLLELYTDTIPATYGSSLDRDLHRVGGDPEKEYIFNDFMVDYIFTQPPYTAKNVRLVFGISDHAAVIGTIAKK